MEEWRKSWLDRTLAVALTLVAGAVSVLLVADVHLFTADPQPAPLVEPMARLSMAENVVRRRPADMPLWDAAGVTEPLFLKDAVFTDQGSAATLTFDDGTRIELGENTLVAVEKAEAKTVLNVMRGSLRASLAASSEAVLIKVDRQGTLLRPSKDSDLRLEVAKDGKARVEVLKGKATVGERGVEIGADQAANLTGATAPVTPETIAVRLTAPAHKASLRLAAGEGVRLRWQAVGGKPPFAVEIARDQGFRDLVATRSVTGDTAVTQALGAGTYWWRIRAGGAVSEERRFDVAAAGGPRLYRPARGEALEAVDDTVQLLWENVAGAPGYHVELARDGKIVVKAQTRGNGFGTPPLAIGKYSWRVRVAEENAAWSSIGAFEVKAKLKLAAIESRGETPRGAQRASDAGRPRAEAGANEASELGLTDGGPQAGGAAPRETQIANAVASNADVAPAPASAPASAAAPAPESDPASAPTSPASPPTPASAAASEPEPASDSTAGSASAPALESANVPASVPSSVSASDRGPASASPPAPAPASRSEASLLPESEAGLAPPSASAGVKAPSSDASTTSSLTPAQQQQQQQQQQPKPEVATEAAEADAPAGATSPVEPISSLRVAYAPSILYYSTSQAGNETNLDAVLFNSVAVNASLWLRRDIALDGSLVRTATVLFRERTASDPPDQKPLVVQPFSTAVAARYRLLREAPLHLDVRAGYGLDNVVRFNRLAGGTLSVSHALVHGPALGAEAGTTLMQTWRLRGSADYVVGLASPSGTVERARLLTLSTSASQQLFELPLSLVYGYAWRIQELTLKSKGDGEFRAGARTHTLLFGAELMQ